MLHFASDAGTMQTPQGDVMTADGSFRMPAMNGAWKIWALWLGMGILGCRGETNAPLEVASAVPAVNTVVPLAPRDEAGVARSMGHVARPDEVRANLIVLPGDATVEVNHRPVRRRNGLIDLVGKPGSEFLVQAYVREMRTEEVLVKIDAQGAIPAVIDATKVKSVVSKKNKEPVVFNVHAGVGGP